MALLRQTSNPLETHSELDEIEEEIKSDHYASFVKEDKDK